jgi:uncharacterized protein (TIGR00255 family)
MTAYGRGEASNKSISVTIELRSSAHRFREVQIRVPKGYLSLEPRIRKVISKEIARGRVEVFVHRTTLDSTHNISADPLLAERYLRAMQQIAKRIQREEEAIPFASIIDKPGVLVIKEEIPNANTEWVLVETALQASIDHLLNHREELGTESKKRLEPLIHKLQQKRTEIEEQIEELSSYLFTRLENKLKRLLGAQIQSRRLSQEAAVLVDKSDISQELLKFRVACDQLAGIIEKTEPLGRKIEFVLQDLNREINIVSSKTPNHEISVQIIDIKTILEQIREEATDLE